MYMIVDYYSFTVTFRIGFNFYLNPDSILIPSSLLSCVPRSVSWPRPPFIIKPTSYFIHHPGPSALCPPSSSPILYLPYSILPHHPPYYTIRSSSPFLVLRPHRPSSSSVLIVRPHPPSSSSSVLRIHAHSGSVPVLTSYVCPTPLMTY